MFGLSETSSEVSKQETKDSQEINRPDLHNSTDVFKFNKRSKDDISGKLVEENLLLIQQCMKNLHLYLIGEEFYQICMLNQM